MLPESHQTLALGSIAADTGALFSRHCSNQWGGGESTDFPECCKDTWRSCAQHDTGAAERKDTDAPESHQTLALGPRAA